MPAAVVAARGGDGATRSGWGSEGEENSNPRALRSGANGVGVSVGSVFLAPSESAEIVFFPGTDLGTRFVIEPER